MVGFSTFYPGSFFARKPEDWVQGCYSFGLKSPLNLIYPLDLFSAFSGKKIEVSSRKSFNKAPKLIKTQKQHYYVNFASKNQKISSAEKMSFSNFLGKFSCKYEIEIFQGSIAFINFKRKHVKYHR